MSVVQQNILGEISHVLNCQKVGVAIQGVWSVREPIEALYHECLGRIVGADGKVRHASEFVKTLEAFGVLAIFDRYILEVSFERLACHSTGRLGCNISAQSLSEEKNWSLLYEVIARNRSLAPRMVLEVTENVPIAIRAQAAEMLSSARSLGCKIAIDDFGTRYSTAEALVSMPADIVKIDALFVRLQHWERAESFLTHLVGLASCVASEVVVEGIETDAQMQAARNAGATHVQGHLFCEPTLLPLYWGRSFG